MPVLEPRELRVDHPVVQTVDPVIFHYTFAADCMTHGCAIAPEGEAAGTYPAGARLDDACCRYGCDVDLFERDAVLARRAEVARVLPPELRDPARWFDESEPENDADTPSGVLVRTARHDMAREDGRCVFLQHDRRGCALHRAALEAGFEPAEIKPAVCRLYPLSLTDGVLALADDFEWYSCAHHQGPSLYQVMRPSLAELFGADAVAALDEVERAVLGRKLRVVVG